MQQLLNLYCLQFNCFKYTNILVTAFNRCRSVTQLDLHMNTSVVERSSRKAGSWLLLTALDTCEHTFLNQVYKSRNIFGTYVSAGGSCSHCDKVNLVHTIWWFTVDEICCKKNLILKDRRNHLTPSLFVAKRSLFSLNRSLRTSRAPLKSQAHQDTSLFTSAAEHQRGFPNGSPW